MWTFKQSTGELINADGVSLAQGYSGKDVGKNNPYMQNIKETGPIPQGMYIIDAPEDSPKHGPFALPLTPYPTNEMFGRSEFLIHGDSIQHPGGASEGCVIMPRFVRDRIWESGDHDLQVIA